MNKEVSEELLDKYAKNTCTDDEKKFVESWYDSYDVVSPVFPDERSGEANRYMLDSKNTMRAMIADIEKSNRGRLSNMGLVQSWFLKIIG